MTSTTLNQIERACADLARDGHPITIAAVAEHAGISRSTIYRNPELRAIIEHHQQTAKDQGQISYQPYGQAPSATRPDIRPQPVACAYALHH